MPSTLNPRPRELGAEEFVAREEEKLRAYRGAWEWAQGPGGVFFANAIRRARPEQVRAVVAAVKAIQLKGALGAVNPERALI